MTGEPNLTGLQFGFANAATLQEKTGIPALFFGLVQTAVLYAIYQAILRKERRISEQRVPASQSVLETQIVVESKS